MKHIREKPPDIRRSQEPFTPAYIILLRGTAWAAGNYGVRDNVVSWPRATPFPFPSASATATQKAHMGGTLYRGCGFAEPSICNSKYHDQTKPLGRIQSALDASRAVFARFTPGKIEAEYKARHNPVTEADRALDTLLRKHLLREGEGWLSEESVDDHLRLGMALVWVVDPLDGTQEFVTGIPEFCTSVALVDNGRPVAGGIYNPVTSQFFLGSLATGVTLNGVPVTASRKNNLQGALILASRSETKRGEWKQFEDVPRIRPTGSVAYKLALVAAGLSDATFTLRPKHEWDVAAGVAKLPPASSAAPMARRCHSTVLSPGCPACSPVECLNGMNC